MSLVLLPLSPFVLVALIPVVIVSLSFGRSLGAFAAGAVLLGAWGLGKFGVYSEGFQVMVYIAVVLMGLMISEMIRAKVHPVKVFLLCAIIGSSAGVIGYESAKHSGFSISEEFQNIRSLESKRLESNKEALASFNLQMDELDQKVAVMKEYSTPLIAVMMFLNIWFVLYFILGSYHLYTPVTSIQYSELSLLNMRLPFFLVWVLIACLSVYLGADYLKIDQFGLAIVSNLMIFMGGLFFIQGLSVVITYLNKYAIFGFVRTFILVMSLFVLSYIVAIIGIMDFWGDFRSRAKKKLKTEIN